MKNTTQQPFKPKWTGPIHKIKNSIRLKWVKNKITGIHPNQ